MGALPSVLRVKGSGDSTSVSFVSRASLHLGVLLFFGGYAPLVAHEVFGCWRAAQLGPWVQYVPFGSLGGFMMLEAVDRRMQREVSVLFALMCLGLFSMSALVVLISEEPLTQLLFGAFALSQGTTTALLLRNALRATLCDSTMLKFNYFSARFISGTCGTMLLGFAIYMAMLDPELAWQHPYLHGILATTTTWIGTGMWCSPQNVGRLVGSTRYR